MSPEAVRLEVIERLVAYIIEKLPSDEAPLLKDFIKQYYLSVSAEDLASRNILDLYGAVLSHWHFMLQRMPGESKVRVYNPDLEEHGWQSKHTIIEISHDDMPFLVDSLSMELNRQGLNIHLIIHMGSIKIQRNALGYITAILPQDTQKGNFVTEAPIYVEIDRQSDQKELDYIADSIQNVLADVSLVVSDWAPMQKKLQDVIATHSNSSLVKKQPEEFSEAKRFIEWIADDHFTLMGYCHHVLVEEIEAVNNAKICLSKLDLDSALGIYKKSSKEHPMIPLSEFPLSVQKVILSKKCLLLGKTSRLSTVHRPAFIDFIVIKEFDEAGNITGAHRFLGLYASVAYNSSLKQIPYLRLKLQRILSNAGFPSKGHDDRALLNILENVPRDDFFEASEEDLLALATGILHLQERQKIRLFIRRDTYCRFYSCLVFVPREKFNSDLREKMQTILMKGLEGVEVSFATRFSESSLARIHFVVRVNPFEDIVFDQRMLQRRLIDAGRSWQDDLRDALVEHYGEEQGNELLKRYGHAFPASYCENFTARMAVVDTEYFETLSDDTMLAMSLYRPLEEPEDSIRFKLFRRGATIPLSDVVPILENMGLRIISERPYELHLKEGTSIWINDYRMVHPRGAIFNAEELKEIFQDAFDRIWHKKAENDGFNRLVLSAKLTWREIMVLRAYAKYLWQIVFSFTQDFVEETFCNNATIAALLIDLFKARFSPEEASENKLLVIKIKIEDALEQVSNLNEDRILRQYLHVIMATLRTNYYQRTPKGQHKHYFSFKINSTQVPEMPLPIPLYEIFVYSTRVEAIHLRVAKVARGGIRWSDRKEDFRTEVLGLMKAQQVKNAVIVPMGAKGGFVIKRAPENKSRDSMMREVVKCYQIFIRGLLDLTDNYVEGNIVPPPGVIRYDDDDPYLVVAADKGTATFSDIANALSKEYNFWLRDAFASGGSMGYDHKKMGITARGVWESVKNHFQEMKLDVQTNDFTVVGIGDMSGDVFGNGMLLSRHIKLIAAFNHMHIFLDPNPNPEKSYLERERMFALPRSGWDDYDPMAISAGGGVFSRFAKSILLSPEIRSVLGIEKERIMPYELIQAILRAPVDLFFNGGIGTYVKASKETNASVGDRTNDAVRVNGVELRARVVGEGGNLGLTQLGRVEYAQKGGRLNTDAIDNSGGVNCSDNEVNIKILLNRAIDLGDLTEKQRNKLLIEMQEEVAELVLGNNRLQTEAISVAASQAVGNLDMHSRLIQEMERTGNLDIAIEYLPGKDEIALRKSLKQGLTRPELAVLMAYSKTFLKKELLASDVPEDPYIAKQLVLAFPVPLQVRFRSMMNLHHLKREIIATQVSNEVINEMGMSFISRLQDETGAEPASIVRAYVVSREIFEAISLHQQIQALNAVIPGIDSALQFKMIQEVNRLVRRGTRWFLRNRRAGFNIEHTIHHFGEKVFEVNEVLLNLSQVEEWDTADEFLKELISAEVPEKLAYKIAGMSAMFSSLDIVEAATTRELAVSQVAAVYYSVGAKLKLGWFREQIKKQPIRNHWEAHARAAFRDDCDRQQRNLTISILRQEGISFDDVDGMIDAWLSQHPIIVARWESVIDELKSTLEPEFIIFSVALRELVDLAHFRYQPREERGVSN
jgi:glutamate dehydrogenase